jgi:cobalt/nickel transport system permease protein
VNFSFIEKTIKAMASFVLTSISLWYTSNRKGFLQKVDERVKLVFLLTLIVLINLTHNYSTLIVLFFLFLGLYIVSGLNITNVYKKVFLLGFLFGFLLFAPASLNLFTKGESVFTIVHFHKNYRWWIYTIPKEISVTREGIAYVIRLTLKLIDSLSLVFLIIYTTTFEKIVKSLSFFKVPGIFLLTLTLSYKYIFILSQSITDTYIAIKMRWFGGATVAEAENIVANRIGYLYKKSWERYETAFQSMTARGFSGKVNFYYFNKLKTVDYIFVLLSIMIVSLVILLNYIYV